jgi:hypothetical protein
MSDPRFRKEEFAVHGDKVLGLIRDLIQEGNVRRITIKNEEGKALIEIPLTVGVVIGVLAPVLAAVGALAAVATKCIIVVERLDDSA